MKAIIFFGHGARDLRWREPFDRLAALWQAQNPGTPVELAFLELMQPSLSGAVQKIVIQGIKDIVVVPVFFGQGSHLRNDFPKILEDCRSEFSEISLSSTPAVGENLLVLQAIINYSEHALR
ncbi:CbiX/SirB N-terminal domain-containing protein [Polynucleobacter sp. AP-Elch-400A-B2]|jgi:sirohydrochlorin cobaltochelatase|uniref:sirohydrochlorin chelatase n=1 Tax=Polynucleobacter sp. AP-Elch-400A-B2 TaxID=2576930 RepID=UPI001BFDED42|nr:CbiX/SirB N-terminal domain-containing protein [Polynucleobacter sp. AP-Elch-400A-B2]QWE24337.1 CbiX/SirB N-terminal domain-containing protein [Polynucleobacter sp. AP-Elch-400A-B2]